MIDSGLAKSSSMSMRIDRQIHATPLGNQTEAEPLVESHPSPMPMTSEPEAEIRTRNGFGTAVSARSEIGVIADSTCRPLDAMPLGHSAFICGVCAPEHAPEWSCWLEEIGFIAGERVTVMARGAFGGDPLVVRVGHSTFALRRAEAQCVLVNLERPESNELPTPAL